MRPVKGSPEDKWSSELCKEGIICVSGGFVCDCDLCSRLNGGGVEDVQEGLEHLPQSVVGCKKRFYGCTSQMAWHGNETSMIYRVSQKYALIEQNYNQS